MMLNISRQRSSSSLEHDISLSSCAQRYEEMDKVTYSIRMPIGSCDVMRSIKALFMNCSSASRVVVCCTSVLDLVDDKLALHLQKLVQL